MHRLLRENELLKSHVPESTIVAGLKEECEKLRAELLKHDVNNPFYKTTEDYDAASKTQKIVDQIGDFGQADFAELSCWIFASSLINHRVVHQRIDEGSMLWRAVKMSAGPILEVGRAAGGSTLLLLGASGARPVVSIDRAPVHAQIADYIFRRPDVSRRLKLYNQTSREPIAESEFGLLFVDADHSYEGVCQDIATFWNSLKPFDGKAPLAVFHDAAKNPISWVEHVNQACRELLAERGAARLVETWGSMLVVEKLGDIDQERWYAKEESGFWEQFATRAHPKLKPLATQVRLHPNQPRLRLGALNFLGDENVEHESWVKRGTTVERANFLAGMDNPTRLVRETPQSGEHGIEKSARNNLSRFNFTVFLRPYALKTVRLSVLAKDRSVLAYVDLELANQSRIANTFVKEGAQIIDAGILYRNGYFGCDLALSLPEPVREAIFAVNALDAASDEALYPGNRERGYFVNLSSVREIV